MDDNTKEIFDTNTEKKNFLSKSKNLKKIAKKLRVVKFIKKTANKIKNKVIKSDKLIKNDNEENHNQTKAKKINPGVDVVRIISIYIIILAHIINSKNVAQLFPQHKRQIRLLLFFNDWHNNGFILISGIVRYKTNSYANLIYLWLTIYFYSVGIHKYIKHFKKNYNIKPDYYQNYYPIIFNRYLFFTAYFGMLLFIPVMNKGINYLTKNELRLVVMLTLGLFAFWRDYKNPNHDVFRLSKGNSVLWFIIYYLTGAYIGKYHVDYTGVKKFLYCLICVFIYSFSSFLYFKSYYNELYLGKGYYQNIFVSIIKRMLTDRFDSLLKIAQSITACLFFLQIKYNKYIAKIICFLGPLVLGVYLIHSHSLILDNYFHHIYDNLSKNASA